MPEPEKSRIVGAALRQIATGPEITAGAILGVIGKLEHAFLTSQPIPYVLATTLSVHSSLRLPRRSVGGATLTATSLFPPTFQAVRDNLVLHIKPLQLATAPDGYQAIRVHLYARSPAEAAQLALDKLDLLRSIWNLHLHNGRFKVTDGRRNDPVNQIVLGPFHSLHHPSGELATNTFWYEPGYRFPPSPLKLNDLAEGLWRFESDVRTALKRLAYRTTMEQALLRYVRALDEHDWQKSFSRLWSLLELITHTQQAKYDVTVRRACFLFEEHGYFRQLLEHLRENRNRATHDDEGTEDTEALMYQLKNIIENLLFRQIFNRLRFNSMAEWGEFLDMPVNPHDLRTEISTLTNSIQQQKKSLEIAEKALKFRTARQADDEQDSERGA